jgi:N-ethylmaleimide reductase
LHIKVETMKNKLFSEFSLGEIKLKNRVVMAPMTRCRAIGGVPNELMAQYYGQRADGGLLVSEGIAPSANGSGYARIPGLFRDDQVAGWKRVTGAVHDSGGLIFAQLMHVGRIGHGDNLPEGAELVAPSAITAAGEMYVDGKGSLPHPEPREMTAEDIQKTVGEFIAAANNAVEAGFDGVELHGANGYLIDQFLNPGTNHRTDDYGGSVDNRARFALEVARGVSEAIGAKRVGIRLSPNGAFNDVALYDGWEDAFVYFAGQLGNLGLSYLHLVDHSAMGAPPVGDEIKARMKKAFGGALILSGGFDRESADAALAHDQGDLIAFGRPYLANPDLVSRLASGAELNEPDQETFYTPDEKGYLDYPTLSAP